MQRRTPRNHSSEPLRHISALPIFDRLPLPIMAIGLNGVLTYANQASAAMLGYLNVESLVGRSIVALLPEHSHGTPGECLAALRTADGSVVRWRHADSCPIPTVVSQPLPVLAGSPQLLIAVTDLTERLWSTGSTVHPPTIPRRPAPNDDTPEPIVA